ncbi:Glutamyl-tRNA(Gln) amidotransferase subunit A [Variovorax sp. SRS16]|uniref:amidase n=1 Tax=Variovorax sp. SRS16 TaxID=282217 RepID=UPI0013178D2F|nr:amidase [Variovorax sp. SRS16]VTU31165.1 Glutamyl-tRNA(Gln) amidotransferase subunit A [Variovorax sp. SRS16]
MSYQDLHYAELLEVSRLLHSRELSPVELTTSMLDRVRNVDKKLHAYVRVMEEDALRSARAAESEIARGEIRGPLHGVPLAIKDIFWTEGVPTASGMAIHKDFVAHEDATAVERLRAAGAVLLGKLTLTEGVYAEHRPPFQAPTNPWSADHWSGASSSGSGVAVAGGLCFAALASETGGSIKLPAAANGVTGVKPTWGRVSRHGVFELAASLDHVGVMARSAADAAAVLGAIAGPDRKDPSAARVEVPDYLSRVSTGAKGLRIGLDPAWCTAGVDPSTAGAVETAAQTLRSLGAELKPVVIPSGEAMIWDWFGICAAQTALAHEATYPSRADEYGPALRDLLDQGRKMSGVELQRLLHRREAFSLALDRVFGEVDLLALPVLSFPTPSMARMQSVDDELIAGLHRFTCPFNMSGHPGIVLPCGFTQEKTPIVFQLVGRRFSEDVLFAAGSAYQRATDWHKRHPSIA